VRVLIDHGADVTALDMTHSTPLHLASVSGIPEIVQILVENGADVNAQNETHSIPLHRASVLGSAESVQTLIENGADITAQDWNHRTSASCIILGEYRNCVTLILAQSYCERTG
jgi:ankyrin repeat protein